MIGRGRVAPNVNVTKIDGDIGGWAGEIFAQNRIRVAAGDGGIISNISQKVLIGARGRGGVDRVVRNRGAWVAVVLDHVGITRIAERLDEKPLAAVAQGLAAGVIGHPRNPGREAVGVGKGHA